MGKERMILQKKKIQIQRNVQKYPYFYYSILRSNNEVNLNMRLVNV